MDGLLAFSVLLAGVAGTLVCTPFEPAVPKIDDGLERICMWVSSVFAVH
jgi:hypothetical protein